MRAHNNPDVTVRSRGVMEKCTYCVQRISRARRAADKEDRPIADGEVVTACQAACPTRAISFGDLSLSEADVSMQRQEPHHYSLLGHLDTRPRTTYLAQVRDLNPQSGGKAGMSLAVASERRPRRAPAAGPRACDRFVDHRDDRRSGVERLARTWLVARDGLAAPLALIT